MEHDCTLVDKVDFVLAALKAEIVRLVEAEVSAARHEVDALMKKSTALPDAEDMGESPKQNRPESTAFPDAEVTGDCPEQNRPDFFIPVSHQLGSDATERVGFCYQAGQCWNYEAVVPPTSDLEAPPRPPLSLRPDPSHGTVNEVTSVQAASSRFSMQVSIVSELQNSASTRIAELEHVCTRFRTQSRAYVWMPTNHWLMAWNVANAILIMLCVWADCLSIVDTFPGGHGPFGFYFEVVVLIVFGTDMLVTFNVAVEYENAYCKMHRVIARTYLKSWFTIDLITLIPWAIFTKSFSGKAGRVARLAKILKMVKASRLIKLFKLAKMSNAGQWVADMWDNLWTVVLASEEGAHSVLKLTRIACGTVKFIFLIFIESYIVVCILLANHSHPNIRWSHNGADAADLSAWKRYEVATFWSFNFVATGSMDYHDLVFQGSLATPLIIKFMVACMHAINLLFVLHIFSKIQGAADLDFRVKVRLMKFFLRKHNVTEQRHKHVLSYLRAIHSIAAQKELYKVIEDELSPHLSAALSFDIFQESITSFHAFQDFPFTEESTYTQLIAHICCITKMVVYPERHVVISASKNPASMYFLRSGQVVVQNEPSCKTQATGTCENSMLAQKSFARNHKIAFYAVDCIFSPAGAHWRAAGDVISKVSCEFGKISRKDFDKMIRSPEFPSIWLSFINFLRSKVGDGSLDASELENGLDDIYHDEWKEIERQKQLAEDRGVTHNELGVSCAYLVSRFNRDLQGELGDCDLLKTTFNDLAKWFWVDAHRGFRGSAECICSLDRLTGSSIVDALEEHEKGKATLYVSWCWKYTVHTLVSSMSRWAIKHNSNNSSCFLWICFFCNNQRKLLVNQEQDDLAESFESKLLAIGNMVMVFDTYKEPLYISRVWCIYEAFTARKVGIDLEVAMPGSCQEDFHKQLVDGGLVDIQQSLTRISVEDAEASFPADKEQIMDLVTRSIGCEAVNEGVKCALMTWLTVAFQDCLRMHTISQPARIVMSVIKMSHSDHDECSLIELTVALGRHPGLLDLFNLDHDMSVEDVFTSLATRSGESQRLHIKHVDSHLKKCHKHTMVAFARWLSKWANTDPALRNFCDEVAGRIQAKTEALKAQLQESQESERVLASMSKRFEL